MERQMLNIRLSDRKPTEWIRSTAKVKDISMQVAQLKWKFAGHNARQKGNRWNELLLS